MTTHRLQFYNLHFLLLLLFVIKCFSSGYHPPTANPHKTNIKLKTSSLFKSVVILLFCDNNVFRCDLCLECHVSLPQTFPRGVTVLYRLPTEMGVFKLFLISSFFILFSKFCFLKSYFVDSIV